MDLVRPAKILEDEIGLEAIPLSVLLLEHVGPDYLTWSSAGLRQELTEKFGPIGPLTWERIQAVRTLHVHEAFWVEWEVFEKVTAAVNGNIPLFNLAQPPDAEEVAIALHVPHRSTTCGTTPSTSPATSLRRVPPTGSGFSKGLRSRRA